MAVAIFILPLPRFSAAADIETLLMPGEVIMGHAEFESECSKCHTRFSKRSQSRLCLDCHEEVDADVVKGEGFHGRLEKTASDNCKSCHSEHLGRAADIVHLNPATFDHRSSDFPLKGQHATVSCGACHSTEEKHREAETGCKSCHEKQEPHKGNLGDNCSSCHSEKSWQEIEFDHDETDFRLEGKHTDASCNACHLNERYEDTPQACNDCHVLNDVHGGSNGSECGDCHNQKDWKKPDFNHDSETDFKLKGRHRQLQCAACHTKPAAEESPGTRCRDCHSRDDAHHGRFGAKCQTCHTEKDWKLSRFDHDRDTDFRLQGKHGELVCSACHQSELYKESLSGGCFNCHKIDDIHEGQEGERCERCHDASGWGNNVIFEHDLSRFPLLGLHAITPCEECHASATFQDASIECHECHLDDDEHDKTLGSDCKQCHNPNAWTAWIFDHAQQTDFELDGAHQDLHCAECHTRPMTGALSQSSQCSSCHKQDDIHQGRFGSDCARCHTSKEFRDVHFN